MPPLLLERRERRLDLLLSRPDHANALNPDLVEALLAAVDEAARSNVHLLTLRGEGKHFCAGFDFSDIDSVSDGDLLLRFVRIETLLQKLYHAPFMTMVLAHGATVGAGADILVACTLRVAASATRIRMPGWQFGLALGTRRLVARIGETEALAILADSSWCDDTHALATGLVSRQADPQDWDALIEEEGRRACVLNTEANTLLLKTVGPRDTRAYDMATLVESASRPGLRKRIVAYKEKVAVQASTKKAREAAKSA